MDREIEQSVTKGLALLESNHEAIETLARAYESNTLAQAEGAEVMVAALGELRDATSESIERASEQQRAIAQECADEICDAIDRMGAAIVRSQDEIRDVLEHMDHKLDVLVQRSDWSDADKTFVRTKRRALELVGRREYERAMTECLAALAVEEGAIGRTLASRATGQPCAFCGAPIAGEVTVCAFCHKVQPVGSRGTSGGHRRDDLVFDPELNVTIASLMITGVVDPRRFAGVDVELHASRALSEGQHREERSALQAAADAAHILAVLSRRQGKLEHAATLDLTSLRLEQRNKRVGLARALAAYSLLEDARAWLPATMSLAFVMDPALMAAYVMQPALLVDPPRVNAVLASVRARLFEEDAKLARVEGAMRAALASGLEHVGGVRSLAASEVKVSELAPAIGPVLTIRARLGAIQGRHPKWNPIFGMALGRDVALAASRSAEGVHAEAMRTAATLDAQLRSHHAAAPTHGGFFGALVPLTLAGSFGGCVHSCATTKEYQATMLAWVSVVLLLSGLVHLGRLAWSIHTRRRLATTITNELSTATAWGFEVDRHLAETRQAWSVIDATPDQDFAASLEAGTEVAQESEELADLVSFGSLWSKLAEDAVATAHPAGPSEVAPVIAARSSMVSFLGGQAAFFARGRAGGIAPPRGAPVVPSPSWAALALPAIPLGIGLVGLAITVVAAAVSSQSPETSPPVGAKMSAPPTAPASPPPFGRTVGGSSVRLVPSSVAASSAITGTGPGGNHPAEYAFDGDPKTAWNESAPGPGKGEWIEARFDGPRAITRIVLTTGYAEISPKWGDLFVANAHLKRFSVVVDGRVVETVSVGSTERSKTVDLDANGAVLRIVADDVYPGARWQDLCVSEIEIFGR